MENILMSDFSAKAQVRIADLGSAIKLTSPTDTASAVIGTPGYVAPEVLQGQALRFRLRHLEPGLPPTCATYRVAAFLGR